MTERPHSAERTSQAAEDERRAWVRYPCSRQAVSQRFTQGSGEPWCPAQIQDISTGGFCLLTNRRFEPGTVLCVELSAHVGTRERLPVARVKRATAGEGGRWVTGCQFLTQLSDEEFEALCSPSHAGAETFQNPTHLDGPSQGEDEPARQSGRPRPRLLAALAPYLPWPLSLATRGREGS